MKTAWLVLALLLDLSSPVLGADVPESSARFAVRLPLTVDGAAPYYRVTLPLAAYLASDQGDLRDLRVFNAAGQPVPHARLVVAMREEAVQRDSLPVFPLHASPQATDDTSLQVRVEQRRDGSLVEIHTQRASAGNRAGDAQATWLSGYVLDASRLDRREAASALELDWETGKTSGVGDFQLLDVAASDDLRHWRPLASGVQLARLDYNGARIENRRIDLCGFQERYLRLLWREPASAPALTAVMLERSRTQYMAAPLAWSAVTAATSSGGELKPGEYRFHLPKPLPLARLRLDLPAGNQLLPFEVLRSDRERWYGLARSVAYRIQSGGREWSNAEIALPGIPLQDFVLRLDPRVPAPAGGPRLAWALSPAQAVFLASGTPPFELAVGNKDARDTALPIATLIPGFGQPNSPAIAEAKVAVIPPGALVPAGSVPVPAGEQDWKKVALWGVLIAGVLGMAGMAWSLLRQMNGPRKP